MLSHTSFPATLHHFALRALPALSHFLDAALLYCSALFSCVSLVCGRGSHRFARAIYRDRTCHDVVITRRGCTTRLHAFAFRSAGCFNLVLPLLRFSARVPLRVSPC